MPETKRRPIRFNSSVLDDMALAATIFEECMELLCGLQQPPVSTESEESCQVYERQRGESERELYAKAADLFEGLTGIPLVHCLEDVSAEFRQTEETNPA
jgi:hypothetical protein